MDQGINDAKPLIWRCLSIDLRFPGRVSKSIKTSNKDHSHYNIVSIKKNFILQTSLYSALQSIYSCNTTKNLTHFTNFRKKLVSGWCQTKHLHGTIFMHPKTVFSKHLESKCLYIPVNLCKKICSRDIGIFLFVWWGLNDFLEVACYFYVIKCFKFLN